MTTPNTIRFNTGRKYTTHGQPITATLHADGTVTFWDSARHIDGQIDDIHAQDFCAVKVLAAYDAGTYRSTARSAADGMQTGGCNTEGAWEQRLNAAAWNNPQKEA